MSTRRLLGGRYEIGEVIGRGGMADVHAGFDTRLSRPVAIKLLRSDLARDSVFLSRFRREAQSAAGLNHPNIVAIFDSGEDESIDPTSGVTVHVPYIVMEVVDGRTLREHLTATGPLAAVEAGRIVEDVLAALDYSHSKGIVHRDIKPANVMLGRGGAVKVMDFGIARAIADSAATMTQTQSVVGTAQYLSPEQAQGKPVDARSDLYSTGCMLFELLTGRTPFVGETAVSIAYQHVGEPATPPSAIRSAVPAAYDAITLHAMVKDREARYQSALEFRDDLVAAREGRPLSAAAIGSAAGARPGLPGASATVGSSAPTTVLAEVPDPDPAFVPQDRMPLEDEPLSRADRRAAQEPPKRRTAAYVLLTLAALAALAVLFILGRSILAQNAKPEQVAVPYLINQTEDQARALLSARKLVMDVRNVTNATVAKGLIVDQDPDSDTMVNVGTSVQVMVSSGPGQAAIPAVAGLNKDAAITQLKLLGFNALGVLVVDDPSQPKDAVISADPPIGSVIPFTNQITLKVASGKVAVPALVDLNQITAQAALSGLKLKYAVAEKVPTADTTILEGTVLSQDVPAGTLVDVGSTVNVKIAIRIASTVTVTSPPPTTAPTSTATSTG
ncbi:MAG: Stk1 family PASTA domain-containing Ser/Thr kinase [Actinomycetales bacterium]|nr:Stk1 family PASTA domain-containing Ser/Thr kinase [Candidatus Phosphoribacter baldrii]